MNNRDMNQEFANIKREFDRLMPERKLAFADDLVRTIHELITIKNGLQRQSRGLRFCSAQQVESYHERIEEIESELRLINRLVDYICPDHAQRLQLFTQNRS